MLGLSIFVLMGTVHIEPYMGHYQEIVSYICLSPLLYDISHCCTYQRQFYLVIVLICSLFDILAHTYILKIAKSSGKKVRKTNKSVALFRTITMLNLSSFAKYISTLYTIQEGISDRTLSVLSDTILIIFVPLPALLNVLNQVAHSRDISNLMKRSWLHVALLLFRNDKSIRKVLTKSILDL